MTLFPTLRLPLLGATLSLGATSCLSPPEYSDTPEIEFNRVEYTVGFDPDGAVETDNVTVVINFRDGDGDLGLESQNRNPPYSEFLPDGSRNRFFNNYFIRIFRRNQQGNWEPYLPGASTSPDEYDSRYPPLNPDGREQPLRGDLSFKLFSLAKGRIPSGSVLRFEVTIADRALNVSNAVVTDPITIR